MKIQALVYSCINENYLLNLNRHLASSVSSFLKNPTSANVTQFQRLRLSAFLLKLLINYKLIKEFKDFEGSNINLTTDTSEY